MSARDADISSRDALSGDGARYGRRRGGRLREWLGPRARMERRGRIGVAVLVAIGLLLAAATITDLVQRVGKDNRFTADIETWRAVMGHPNYLNLTTERGEEEDRGTTDVICANTSAGPAGFRTQLCLILTGPVLRDGRRADPGGYYLPPHLPDRKAHRFGCFGIAASEHWCEASGL